MFSDMVWESKGEWNMELHGHWHTSAGYTTDITVNVQGSMRIIHGG